MTIHRNYLDTRKRFLLTQKVHTDYPGSGMTDVDFAKKMETELGFPVTAQHVMYIRHSFKIPTNTVRAPSGNSLKARVEALEDFIEILKRERRERLGH